MFQVPIGFKSIVGQVTGNLVCPMLGLVGSWTQLQEVIDTWVKNRTRAKGDEEAGYPKLQKIELKLPAKVEKVWDAATPVDKLTKPQFNELLRNFRQVQRDFNQEDFSRFDARVETGSHDKLYFPVRYLGRELVGLRMVRVVGNRLEEEDLPTPGRHSSGFLPFIHNLDAVAASGAKECVVVGSVLDTVVLSTRCDVPAIVLPDMASLHPDLLPFLEQFTSVTLWLGSDVMTSDVMAIFARKIGEQVCSVVGGQHPCALAAVRKKLNVVEILDKARTCHHDYITSFEKLREEVRSKVHANESKEFSTQVYLEFVNSEQMEGVKWKRFQEFNGLLRGFRRGEMTILTGRTGSGKTTFLSEYSLDLCMEGVNTLWGSFEVKNVRLIKMLLKQHSLINLDDNVHEFDTVAESFQKLPMYFSTFHGAAEVDAVLEAMAHAVYVHDIAHVIIDNIQFMIGSRNGSMDRFSQQDIAIERFRKFATLHNCHVTLVIHPRKDAEGEMLSVHSVYGGGKATQEADNVLLLQEEQADDSFFKKKYIELVKNRYAGDLGIVPLAFTKPFLTMSKKVANEAKKKNMKKKSLPLVTKKKNGEIVQEAMETLIKPDNIETLVKPGKPVSDEKGIRKPSST